MKLSSLTLTASAVVSLLTVGNISAGITGVVNTGSNDPTDVYVAVAQGMAEGAEVHIDRAHTFSTLPDFLTGIDYVKTANDDKNAAGLTLDLTLDEPVTLYLSLDNRIGNNLATNPPTLGGGSATQWVIDQEWVQTTQTWEKVGDLGKPYTVYTHICLASNVTLFGQNYSGNMYSLAAAPYTNPVTRYASIDIGPNGQRLEPGWSGLTAAPATDVSNVSYGPTNVQSRVFKDIILSGSLLDWRDRGNSTNNQSLVRVGEDFVKRNDGKYTLTLDDLPQGHYTATSYHLDPGNSQCPRIQVYVSDCVSADRLQPTYGNAYAAVGGVNGLTTSNIAETATSFEFWSNGTDPVTLRFQGTPGISARSNPQVIERESPVNGLDLMLNTATPLIALEQLVFIDIGPDGQRVVTNGIALPGAPGYANNQNYPATELTADDGSTFTLKIDSLNTNGVKTGGIDWRDRGDSISYTNGHELAVLGEDFIKNNLGMIRVTLGGLKAGSYRVESYHTDSDTTQCEEIFVYVTDADGTAVLQRLAGDAGSTRVAINSMTDESIKATGSAFEIRSDGSNDVIIYFDGTGAGDKEAPLNGVRIEKIIDTTLPPVYPKGTILMMQ